jgi:phosphoribosylpyrophosphate synthetase
MRILKMETNIKDITLDELGGLTETLLHKMRSSYFEPDLVIYLETGARLLASHFHRLTGVQAIPLTIQRSGHGGKARIARLLRSLPRFFQDGLRRVERQFSLRRSSKRKIASAPEIDLSGKRVLILDDAADSGRTLLLAKQWVLENGGFLDGLRIATIAVTQPQSKEMVDFWIYAQLCRFPWSSDSREREEYLRLYEQVDPSKFAPSYF